MSLRDHLLSKVQGYLTVLTSKSRRTTLFPYAVNPPKCFEKEYFITLGREEVLTAAIHAYLYTIPSTSTSILYISKVDTSGYAPVSTRSLVGAFLTYFLQPQTRPTRHVEIALFARSQAQYLFPNSSKSAQKRVSGGLKLCQWWKAVYESLEVTESDGNRKLRYLLPSYDKDEAAGMIGRSSSSKQWDYGPPFERPFFGADNEISEKGERKRNLAWCIPALPDDPKTRFMDELIAEVGAAGGGGGKDKSKEKAEAALREVSVEEFWERMGFRQECSSGDVTGFFHLSSDQEPIGPGARIGKEHKGELESEKSGEVQDEDKESRVANGAEEGKDGHDSMEHRDSGYKKDENAGLGGTSVQDSEAGSTSKPSTDLPISIVDRIHTSLLNTDFGTLESAIEGTKIWRKSTEAIVKDEIGEEGWALVVGFREVKEVAGEKRKEEAVTMLQPRKRAKQEVNTLQPRRRE